MKVRLVKLGRRFYLARGQIGDTMDNPCRKEIDLPESLLNHWIYLTTAYDSMQDDLKKLWEKT